ncbi:MAG: hypothetical protein MJ105_07965 [Lachnospiraceae bacterium]|nr:hypothetical protein [Lachnospiraceae bacterium]
MKRNKIVKKCASLLLAIILCFMMAGGEVLAAPVSETPLASFLPMWYYMFDGSTTPAAHDSWISYYSSSTKGELKTTTMPGTLYIQQNGMSTYCTKETLNLPQFLADNPIFVELGITDRDTIWAWLCANDSLCPLIIHSTNMDEEFYCILRDWCIILGTYNWAGNTLPVAERTKIIDNFLCQAYCYDYSYSVYDFQTMMLTGTGVCNAYAGMFDAMASMSGINAGVMVGPNHIWNAVQTEDGQWYVVDSTWNDAGSRSNGYYLLKKRHGGGMNAYQMSWWITEDLY